MIEKLLKSSFQRFARIESLSGIFLFGATIVALIWANSPLYPYYEELRNFKIGIVTDVFELNKPIILWVNDGLMAIFFFLIGLEIKRELVIGELNTLRKASFPFIAAIGGMIIPVGLYLLLNNNPETAKGWGIPMAADIAFALAILNLLGKRIPIALKVFLTAFAIIDDLGAVMVIAVFYSASINWSLVLIALGMLMFLFLLAYLQIHAKYLILFFGIIIWYLFLKSGIHPTIAGVLLAFTVPIRQKIDTNVYRRKLGWIFKEIKKSEDNGNPTLTPQQIDQIDELEEWTRRVQSPLQMLEYRLHNYVAFLIMPVFALVNAGVSFQGDMDLNTNLIITIAISLFVGNFVGVSLISLLGLKLRITELPEDVDKIQIIGVSFLAGVGFTMSIFIANLAFAQSQMFIDSAKIGILIGSVISGLAGYFFLRLVSKEKALK